MKSIHFGLVLALLLGITTNLGKSEQICTEWQIKTCNDRNAEIFRCRIRERIANFWEILFHRKDRKSSENRCHSLGDWTNCAEQLSIDSSETKLIENDICTFPEVSDTSSSTVGDRFTFLSFLRPKKRQSDNDLMIACFCKKSQNLNRVLKDKFLRLVDELLPNTNYDELTAETKKDEIFQLFDTDKDGEICYEEFKFFWKNWVRKLAQPKSALMVVDVQNDFIINPDALPVNEGEQVIPVINALTDNVHFDTIVYTHDWHPDDHISFYKNFKNEEKRRKLHESFKKNPADVKIFDEVVFEGTGGEPQPQVLWPTHCVQNSDGAKLHQDLEVVDGAIHVYKGQNPDIDSYSAFWDNGMKGETNLAEDLRKRNITRVYISGLAYDYCVRASAIHATLLGLETVVIDDASRGVSPEGVVETKRELSELNVWIIQSSDVENIAENGERWLELGYARATHLFKK